MQRKLFVAKVSSVNISKLPSNVMERNRITSVRIFIWQVLLLAGLYFAVGQASFALFVTHNVVTLVIFASEGFALAAVVLFGKRLCLGVFLGQLLLALYNGLTWEAAVGLSAINSVEAFIGATLFQRFALSKSLTKMRDVSGLLLLIFFALQPFSASLGVLWLWLNHVIPTTQLALSWFFWWFGNALGQVLVTPLLLVLFGDNDSIKQKLRPVFWLTLLIIPVMLIRLLPISFSLTLAFTVSIPLLIFIAHRGGMAMVTLAIFVLAPSVLFLTQQRVSDNLEHGDMTSLIELNAYLLSISIIGQFIAALLAEHNQALVAQQRTADHLQKIADHFPGMIYQYRLNPDGSSCFPYASIGIHNIYRVSPESVQTTAESIFAVLHPDDYERIVNALHLSAQQLSVWQQEYRVRFADGSVRWLSGHSIPQRETSGATLWHGFIEDITPTKQQEIEYCSIIEASTNGFFCNDFSGRLLSVNSALCKMLGYSEAEMLTLSIMDIEASEAFADTEKHIQYIIQTGYDTFETKHKRKNGSVIDVKINVLYVDTLGQRFFVFVEDITASKQAQEALFISEEKYRSLFSSIQDGIVFVDMLGNIVECNQCYIDMLGYNEDELIGMNFNQVTPEKWHDYEADIIGQRMMITGYSELYEKEYIKKDSTVFPVDLRAWLIKDKQGNNRGMWAIVRDISERKFMEAQLRKSHDELQHYFDQPFIGMLSATHDRQTMHVNQRFCDIVGYSQQEMQTIDWGKLTYPDDFAPNQAYLEQAIRGEIDSYEMEKRYIHKHGHLVYVNLAVHCVRRTNGHPDYFIGMMQDITERKQVEKTLQESQALLQTAQRAARMGHYVTELSDVDNISWTSDAILDEIFGIDGRFVRNVDNWRLIIHDDDKQRVMDYFHETIRQHQELPNIEYRIIRPSDGVKRWVTAWGFVFYDEQKRPIRQVGIIQDITERKLAETELRIAATVFEAQEGMMISDEKGVILKVNHAFTTITGYSAEEVIGNTPKILQSGRHDEDFYRMLWQRITGEGVWQGEIWNRRKNGEVYPQWLTITAVKNDNALVTHYVATLIDITERKAAEDYINQLAFYDSLTQLPNRRLLQERLKHSIEVSYREGKILGVLMMDLDKFKAVNDCLGHSAGDELLQQVADRIKSHLREMDMVARLGGDEFVILLEGLGHCNHAAKVANTVIDVLCRPFTVLRHHEVHIGASIGIALYPEHGDSAEKLLDNADAALYHAKDQGRSCYAYFSAELEQKKFR